MNENIEKSKNFLSYNYFSDCFKDVTLVCDDLKQLRAHRNVLSFFSPFFEKLFSIEAEVGGNMVIILKGIKFVYMEAILKYLYLGEFEMDMDNEQTSELLSATKTLEIDSFGWLTEKTHHNKNLNSIKSISTTNDAVEIENIKDRSEGDVSMPSEDGLETPRRVSIQNVTKCPSCYRVFSGKRSLRIHLKSEHKKQLNPQEFFIKEEPSEISVQPTKKEKNMRFVS